MRARESEAGDRIGNSSQCAQHKPLRLWSAVAGVFETDVW